MVKTTTRKKAKATRTLQFFENRDDLSPIAGLLVIAVGDETTVYVVTEFPTGHDGRGFYLTKPTGDGYSAFCFRHGEAGDSCNCPGSYYGGKCRHRDALRKLLELGKL